jgi:hypothetical protein
VRHYNSKLMILLLPHHCDRLLPDVHWQRPPQIRMRVTCNLHVAVLGLDKQDLHIAISERVNTASLIFSRWRVA